MAIREHEAIDLRLNVLNLDARETLNTGHVNLVVEVADVHRDEQGRRDPRFKRQVMLPSERRSPGANPGGNLFLKMRM